MADYGVNINLRVKGQSGLDRLNAKVKQLTRSVDDIRQIDIMNPRNTGGKAGQGARNELKDGDETILEIYWNPLTIAERESIVARSGEGGSNEDFALNLMITKALDKNGNRLFQDGHKASLRREVNATTLQDIQLAMLNSGSEYKLEEAKADLKS